MEDPLEARQARESREAALRACIHDLRNQVMPLHLRLDVARRLVGTNDSDPHALSPLLDAMTGSVRTLAAVVARLESLLDGPSNAASGTSAETAAQASTVTSSTALAHGREPTLPGSHGLRLLIVDDNPALAEALVELLQSDGRFAEVHCAGSVTDALARASHAPYDLALVDVHLADGDGMALCAQLVTTTAQRVVLMSGSASSILSEQAHAHGALGWIAKGADLHDLPDRLFALAAVTPVPPQSRPAESSG